MDKSPDAFRTISEVAEWLDSPTHVLRFWESKFTQIKPVKRAGGRRYYRPADMQLLGGIKKLLHDDGLTIKGVQKILREEGVKYIVDLAPPLDLEPEHHEAPAPETAQRPAPKPEPAPRPAPEPVETKVVPFNFAVRPTAEPAPKAAPVAEKAGDSKPAVKPEPRPGAAKEAAPWPIVPLMSRMPEDPSDDSPDAPAPTLASQLRLLPTSAVRAHHASFARLAAQLQSIANRMDKPAAPPSEK